MITNLSKELLNNVQQYCENIDWKYLMDTSKEFFSDVKYSTIHVYVSFRKLNDRVLPPIVAELSNPLQQLHLYLNTEKGVGEDGPEVKTSWKSSGKWRTRNLITQKDIKWFLSIPAQSINWHCAGPFLLENPIFMKALRKYENIKLDLNSYISYDELNNSKRIKFLSLTNGWSSELPKLPSLMEFTLSCDVGDEIDLRNLVYSLSLKKITFEYCRDNIPIPKLLKERGVIINCKDDFNYNFVEVDAEQSNDKKRNDKENDDNDDDLNIYDEDEVTVYGNESGEYEDYSEVNNELVDMKKEFARCICNETGEDYDKVYNFFVRNEEMRATCNEHEDYGQVHNEFVEISEEYHLAMCKMFNIPHFPLSSLKSYTSDSYFP